jgi:hypothetical protein
MIQSCGPGSVLGTATGYGLDGPGIHSRWGRDFSAPVQTGPGACTLGTGSFPGVKSGRDVTLTPHPLLVPWSWKSRAIPLFPLWAVWPEQNLSACTRVHFTMIQSFKIEAKLFNSQRCSSYVIDTINKKTQLQEIKTSISPQTVYILFYSCSTLWWLFTQNRVV